jgi:hypothetical protein
MNNRATMACVLCFALSACGSDTGSNANDMRASGGMGGAAGVAGVAGGGAGGVGGTQPSGGMSASGGTGGAAGTSIPGGAGGAGGIAGAMSGGMGGAGGMMGGMGGAGGDAMPDDGPVDGDPAKPMVEIPGIPCGVPTVGFTGSPPTVQITGRDVVVAYPCMHEGADVTFFLFLHGTLGEEQKVPFTMAAFPIHKHVDSDNVIVVVPKAIKTQWGNGDDGQDQPHLYEVVDWVYDTFGTKVDIRSMWASGGSAGAFYLGYTFACDPQYADRLRGVRMVVGGGCPSCSDRLACIVAQQELELGGGMTLTDPEKEMRIMNANIESFAVGHGCDARTGPTSLGPVRAWTWANCDSGFAHSYYLGAGEHADRWDDPTSLAHMVEEIKSIER